MEKKISRPIPSTNNRKESETMTSEKGISRRNFLTTGAAVAGGLMLGACGPAAPAEEKEVEVTRIVEKVVTATPEPAGERLIIYYNTHGPVDMSFWAVHNNGFQAYCQAHNIDGRYVGTVRDADFAEEAANMERIIAAGDADGVAVVFCVPEMFDEPVRKFHEAGVPVVLVGCADPRPKEEQVPHLCYIGQEEFLAGRKAGEIALDGFRKVAGRAPTSAIFLEHAPGSWILAERARGMRDVLEPEGVAFEHVAGEVDPVKCSEALRAYLETHPEVEVIHTAWSRPAAWSIEVLREMGTLGNTNEPFEEGKKYVMSIDVDPGILESIVIGECFGTIDQQVYLQGWYAPAVLQHYIEHSFEPATDLITGPFGVTPDNAASFIEAAEKGFRA